MSLPHLSLLVLLLIVAAGSPPADASPNPQRPNVVLILADDLGWADVGFHGGEIATPHLDTLAARGVRCEQFYVQPTCSPTRIALMTGRYTFRTGGQMCVLRPYHAHGAPLEDRFLSEMLRDAGYRTAITGKWHLGLARRAYWPTSRGFDLQYGPLGGAVDYFTHDGYGTLDWQDQDQIPLDEKGYATELLGDRATQIIRDHDFAAQPLFLYAPFTAPHTPLQARPDDLARYAHIENKQRRTYAAMVHALDEQVGRIVAAIDAAQATENTLIFLASDNGGHNDGADNRPLRGGKGTMYEGGIRVPTIAVWPGRLDPGTTFTPPLHVIDLFPTLAGLAGGSLEGGRPLDGIDVWPALTGAALPERDLAHNVIEKSGRGSLRQGDWKLVINRADKTPHGIPLKGGKLAAELFNLADDPNESTNLAPAHLQRVQDMWVRLKVYGQDAGDYRPYCVPKPDDWVAPADFAGTPE